MNKERKIGKQKEGRDGGEEERSRKTREQGNTREMIEKERWKGFRLFLLNFWIDSSNHLPMINDEDSAISEVDCNSTLLNSLFSLHSASFSFFSSSFLILSFLFEFYNLSSLSFFSSYLYFSLYSTLFFFVFLFSLILFLSFCFPGFFIKKNICTFHLAGVILKNISRILTWCDMWNLVLIAYFH